MFTGLIQEIGTIQAVQKKAHHLELHINAQKVTKGGNIGDSIAVNGVCLTAVTISDHSFSADVMPETWRKSSLPYLKVGERVNLEKSVTPATALGGHLVYGDVDTLANIVSIRQEEIATLYQFEIDEKWMKYIALKGRVAVDGASLTVMDRTQNRFTLSLIPHSLKNLTLGNKKVGDKVNIEIDIMAKYCETLLLHAGDPKEKPKSNLTLEKLLENGF